MLKKKTGFHVNFAENEKFRNCKVELGLVASDRSKLSAFMNVTLFTVRSNILGFYLGFSSMPNRHVQVRPISILSIRFIVEENME